MKHLYVRKFSQLSEGSQKVLFFIFLLSSFILKAQNYPEPVLVSSVEYQDYEIPTESMPDYLSTFTNEFGNEVMRISDKDVFGTSGQRLRHHYTTDQTFNSDGSLVKFAGYPAAILDGETFEFLYWSSIPKSATWSNLDPNIMYGVSGNTLVRYNVETSQRTTLHTFPYDEISYGFNKGNMSNDDRYIGLIGETGNDLTLIVFDILNNEVLATEHIGNINLAWFSVSPLGNYAVTSFSEDGSDVDQGLKVYDIDLTNYRHVNDYTTHADLGIDAYGNEVYVSFGDVTTRQNDYYLKMVRLSDGLVTPLFHYTSDTGVWGGHVSCRNTDRPGYAYVTESCCDTDGKREMFAIKLDDSNIIERFGMHHSDKDPGYGHSAMGVPNRDGSIMIFGSNWEDDVIKGDQYPPAFIVKAPSTSLSVENESINEIQIKVYPNPSNGLVNIKLDGSISVKSIQVYDVLGRSIRTEDMDSNEKSLNLSNLPQGVYLLSFITESNGSVTKRIILN
jgi:hypothetical protein